MIIDLTRNLYSGMPVFPGDEAVSINKGSLKTSLHAGTHIDAPFHMDDRGLSIEECDLSRFFGRGRLLDVRGEKQIEMKDIYLETIKPDDIVLFYTGQTNYAFDNYPSISYELAQFLVKQKIKMIGLDTPSPDYAPYEIHKLLLKENILILENLTNLDKLLYQKSFEVIALPLKIKADASPVRAIARPLKSEINFL